MLFLSGSGWMRLVLSQPPGDARCLPPVVRSAGGVASSSYLIVRRRCCAARAWWSRRQARSARRALLVTTCGTPEAQRIRHTYSRFCVIGDIRMTLKTRI